MHVQNNEKRSPELYTLLLYVLYFSFSCVKTKTNKFCRKTCWKEQPFIFTVYLMNHLFQTAVFIKCDNGMYNIELNSFCKNTKKLRSSQAAVLLLNWIKHSFSLWDTLRVSLINLVLKLATSAEILHSFFIRTSKTDP